MSALFRLRKTCRRLISDSKGFSSIVGAVFAVLVMISLISTVFVWSLSQNTLYNNTVTQTRQADLDRSNEKIVANVTVSRVDGNNVAVNGNLSNDGPLSVQIVTLWVVDANPTTLQTTYAFKSPLSITLKTGNVTILSGSTAITVPLANSPGDSLSCWFISGRGNTIFKNPLFGANIGSGTIPPYAYVSGGIGSLAFDFGSLTYYTVSNNKLTPYPGGTQTYTVPAVYNLAFGFNITNYNKDYYNITLDNKSMMWSYFAAVPGHTLGPVWCLVSTQADTIQTTYSPITLQYNATRFLIFASQSGSFDQAQHNALGAVNLLFFGNYTTTSGGNTVVKGNYGQNIPFVAAYFSP